MSWFRELPEEIAQLVQTRVSAEFATVTATGIPIDTPTFCFLSADLQTLDVATGLAYPAKAERARRNPKVGMLFEGAANEPVVSIAGLAAVRDADLQGNLVRYASETILTPMINPETVGWPNVRKMDWYLARIFVCVAPVHVRWWDRRSEMDQPPHEWRAAAEAIFPTSDAAPVGKLSDAPAWRSRTWREMAESALEEGLPGHLTLLDPDGYPLPMRGAEVRAHPEGFVLLAPGGAPWTEGQGTLSFVGKDVFVGRARKEGVKTIFQVERALPVLPLMAERAGPNAETRAALRRRMEQEAARRGQPVPVVPEHPPTPTDGAQIRANAYGALDRSVAGGGIHQD